MEKNGRICRAVDGIMANDLTGKKFGYLKVEKREGTHVSLSGQKKALWKCECLLCGNKTVTTSGALVSGTTKSCGCLMKHKGKMARNKKICEICGKEFECPPSSNKVTCSGECRREKARRRKIGTKLTEHQKNIISQANKNISEERKEIRERNRRTATEAAKKSPKSGKFITHKDAIDWHLISPEGKHYQFHSLNYWLRENAEELFGCKTERELNNVRTGLSGAKRAMMGGSYRCLTYKGWQVIPTEDDSKKKIINEEKQENSGIKKP